MNSLMRAVRRSFKAVSLISIVQKYIEIFKKLTQHKNKIESFVYILLHIVVLPLLLFAY